MSGTTKNTTSWIKELTDLFESATAREIDHLNDKTNDQLKWFNECATISQLLAWGKKQDYPIKSKTTKKDLNVMMSSELPAGENYGITPEDFVEAKEAEESPASNLVPQEISETKASDLNRTMYTNEILNIVEEKEIQLAPELDNILNYDPKEVEYIGDTPELIVDTQTQSQRSSSTSKKTDNIQNNDEIMLFVSNHKSKEYTTTSPVTIEIAQTITHNLIHRGLNKSSINTSAINSANIFISPSQSSESTNQQLDLSSIKLNNNPTLSNTNIIQSENNNIPADQSTATKKNTPTQEKHSNRASTIDKDLQNNDFNSLGTAKTKKSVEVDPIVQNNKTKPIISSEVEKIVETKISRSTELGNMEASSVKRKHASEHSNILESQVENTPVIEVSDVMPQKPFRKKLRLANLPKKSVEKTDKVKNEEVKHEADKVSAKRKPTTPSWAIEPELFLHMKNQESIDPDSIFGPCAPVIMKG